ncbi:structural protein MipA [Campylobacterota bacterium]|nr:structural protein MipA [Campylobacterota bacterium]
MRRSAIAFVLLCAVLCANEGDRNASASRFRYSIGAGVASIPYFETSPNSKVRALPYAEMSYGAFFLSPMKGIGADIRLANVVISPAISFRSEREADSDKAYKGLGDVAAEATYGVSAALIFQPFVLHARAFNGFDSSAAVYDFGVNYLHHFNKSWGVMTGVGAQYGSEKYNQTYYGITAKQSAESRNHYDEYAPKAGLTSAQGNIGLIYHTSSKSSVSLFVRSKVFVGEAEDSPIIKYGSDHSTSFGLLYMYSPYGKRF